MLTKPLINGRNVKVFTSFLSTSMPFNHSKRLHIISFFQTNIIQLIQLFWDLPNHHSNQKWIVTLAIIINSYSYENRILIKSDYDFLISGFLTSYKLHFWNYLKNTYIRLLETWFYFGISQFPKSFDKKSKWKRIKQLNGTDATF